QFNHNQNLRTNTQNNLSGATRNPNWKGQSTYAGAGANHSQSARFNQGMGRPASRLRIDTLETHRPQVELLDEGLDHPYRIVLRHVIIDTLGQQTDLRPIHTFDESLHRARPVAFDAVFYRHGAFLHRLGRVLPGGGRSPSIRQVGTFAFVTHPSSGSSR